MNENINKLHTWLPVSNKTQVEWNVDLKFMHVDWRLNYTWRVRVIVIFQPDCLQILSRVLPREPETKIIHSRVLFPFRHYHHTALRLAKCQNAQPSPLEDDKDPDDDTHKFEEAEGDKTGSR